MRKILSILILLLLAFNWFGYRLMFNYLQQSKDSQLEAKFDNNSYDESQLIEIRVPLNMPYQNNWSGFERYDGEVTVKGVLYKYVKRKVENNQLVLLCYPNSDKMHLLNARDEFFKLANDFQQHNESKKPTAPNTQGFKNLLTEYVQQDNNWQLSSFEISKKLYIECNLLRIREGYPSTPEQPPKI
ncbi:MAG: hypothetical protein HYX40_07030 [Sphingobacteriales bacterium]|nr:hypothetical protein [Sphingobacteriales bacterium]